MLMLETSVAQLLESKETNVVWTVEANTLVSDAARFMAEKNVGSLLVCEQGEIAGLLTERDCVRNLLGREGDLFKGRGGKIMVGAVMSATVFQVPLSATVEECFTIMTEQRTRHLVVSDDSAIWGIISIGDVVRWLIDDHRFTIEQLELYLHGDYAPLRDRLEEERRPSPIFSAAGGVVLRSVKLDKGLHHVPSEQES